MGGKKKNAKLMIIVGVVVALGIGLWAATHGGSAEQPTAEKAEPVKVQAITAAEQQIPDEVWASGTVAPVSEAKIAPRIMSTVSAVYVKEGDRVRAGQVLARLEARDLAAQVAFANAAVNSAQSMHEKASTGVELQAAQTKANIANAEANLQIAKQQLSLAKEGPRRQEKLQSELAVAQANAQFKNAETELARMQRLYDQGVIPKQRLEGVQTQHDVAKAQLEIAKQQYEMTTEGTRGQDLQSAVERVRQAEESLRLAKAAAVQNKMAVKEAQASASMVNQARAGENSAKVMLGYATLVSPISGVVTARYVDPGDTASPGVPVLVVQDDSVYRLEASVAAKDVGEVRAGMTVGIELGSDKRTGTGKVALVVPAGDPATRKFMVKVIVPKELNPISGDFGKASFKVGSTKGIVVPEAAIHDHGGIINVYVIGTNNRTDMRIVRLGRRTSAGMEIITGLLAGDRIIVQSSGELADDVPVVLEGSQP